MHCQDNIMETQIVNATQLSGTSLTEYFIR